MNYLWQKYILKELLLFFLLVISCFYFLYVLIDYATHVKTLHQEHLPFTAVLFYYLCQFTKRAELLLPISLLVAAIRVLTTLNTRNELTALRVGGISKGELLKPLALFALSISLLLYGNFQFLLPSALSAIDRFEKRYFAEEAQSYTRKVHALPMQNNRLLLYQSYHSRAHKLFDVYWVKSHKEIFRIKELSMEHFPFVGTYVDHLKRQENGRMTRVHSYDSLPFPDLVIPPKMLDTLLLPPTMQSLSQLFLQSKHSLFTHEKLNHRSAESVSLLFFKLSLPLLALVALLGPVPFCMRMSRSLPLFWIYSLSLAALIGLYTLLHALSTLSQAQLLPAWSALVLPFALLCAMLRPWKRLI